MSYHKKDSHRDYNRDIYKERGEETQTYPKYKRDSGFNSQHKREKGESR
jgi:hypothetical protein